MTRTGETTNPLSPECTQQTNADDEARRVHFQAPADLLERLDTIADRLDADRTDLLIEAVREYNLGRFGWQNTGSSDAVCSVSRREAGGGM